MIRSGYLGYIFDRERFKSLLQVAEVKLKKVDFDAFAVRGNSGAIFGGAIASRMDKGLFLIRKTNESTHSYQEVEGDDGNRSYIFLDDFIDSGATRSAVVEAMERKFPNAKRVGDYLYNANCVGDGRFTKCG